MNSVDLGYNYVSQEHKASELLFKQLHQGNTNCQKLAEIYQEKIRIEQEYHQKLKQLCVRTSDTKEIGGMKAVYEVLAGQFARVGDAHLKEAQQIDEEIMIPLLTYAKGFGTKQQGIEGACNTAYNEIELLKQAVEQAKSDYSEQCIQLYHGSKTGISNSKMVGLEELVHSKLQNYNESVKHYDSNLEHWKSQWQDTSKGLEQLEVERMNFVKKNIWDFTNVMSNTILEEDDAYEQIRLKLERCDTAKDIKLFVESCTPASDNKHDQSFSKQDKFDQSFSNSMNSTLNCSPRKQVTFTQSTNTSSVKQEQQYTIKKEPEDFATQQVQVKSPFGTVQAISRSPPQQHIDDNVSTSGSSTNESNTMSHYASSHTSSNLSTNSKNWNSPTRRRSKIGLQTWQEPPKVSPLNLSPKSMKLQMEKQAQIMRYNEQNQHEDSLLNTSTMRNFNPEEVGEDDPLRAAWEDLKIGGNGDFSALKERHNSIKSAKSVKPGKNKDSYKRKSMIEILKKSTDRQLQQQEQVHQQSVNQHPVKKSNDVASQSQNNLPNRDLPAQSVKQRTNVNTNPRPKSMIEIAEMNHMNLANTKIPLAPNGLPLVATDGRQVVRHAKAVYDYSASIPEEVSFKRKDNMLVLSMQDDGWWEVEVVGQKQFGLAPSNYLVPA